MSVLPGLLKYRFSNGRSPSLFSSIPPSHQCAAHAYLRVCLCCCSDTCMLSKSDKKRNGLWRRAPRQKACFDRALCRLQNQWTFCILAVPRQLRRLKWSRSHLLKKHDWEGCLICHLYSLLFFLNPVLAPPLCSSFAPTFLPYFIYSFEPLFFYNNNTNKFNSQILDHNFSILHSSRRAAQQWPFTKTLELEFWW